MIASVNLYHRQRRKGAALEVDEHEITKTQEPINRSLYFDLFLESTLSRVDLFLERFFPTKSIMLPMGLTCNNRKHP